MNDIMTKMGGIIGSMTSALGFANIKLNVFGCELKPTPSDSDYYTLCTGGSGAPQQQMTSNKAVEERAQNKATITVPEEKSFVEPTKGQKDTTTSSEDANLDEDLEEDDGTTWTQY